MLKTADGPAELVVSPAAMVFYKGENRYPFGVFERDRTQVSDAEVALYFARSPTPEDGREVEVAETRGGGEGAERRRSTQPAVGPFPAAIESLATKPAFRAQTTSERPRRRRVVYVTESISPATASGGSPP